MNERRDNSTLLDLIKSEMAAFKEEAKIELRQEVKQTVNGNIKRIDEKLDNYIGESKIFRESITSHIEKSNKESELIRPLLERVTELTNLGDGIKTANNITRFFKWVGGLGITALLIGGWQFIKFMR